MYKIASPTGVAVSIPSDISEDHPYFLQDQLQEANRYLKEEGYVVLRGLIPASLCDQAMQSVQADLKPYRGYLYRQTTQDPERHTFNERGFIMNPVLNMQDVPTASLGNFRQCSLEILTSAGVQAFTKLHFGEPGKLMQSMFFQGNTATWAHQDTYYLDGEEIGSMVAGWFALEDIQPGAGRFYVYPRSHLIDIKKHGGDFDIAFNHQRYKGLIVNLLSKSDVECVAPALRKGDVLFWNSKTIHGSLPTTQPEYSRSSFTGHYIPESSRFLQFQSRFRGQKLKPYNGMLVHHPKSLDDPMRKAVLAFETTFPKTYRLAKQVAIKTVVSLR